MIEPIRDVLSSPIQGEAMDVDRRWVRVLSQQVQAAEVELTADLAQVPVTFEQILNMRKGDVLPINIPEHITAKVDGVPVMECGYGIFNGQYALRVQKMISAADTMKDGGMEGPNRKDGGRPGRWRAATGRRRRQRRRRRGDGRLGQRAGRTERQ